MLLVIIGHGPAQLVNIKSNTVAFLWKLFSVNDKPSCVINENAGTFLMTVNSYDEFAFWITHDAPEPKSMIQIIIRKIFLFMGQLRLIPGCVLDHDQSQYPGCNPHVEKLDQRNNI